MVRRVYIGFMNGLRGADGACAWVAIATLNFCPFMII
nr:MAG TPA: hypothetical protein [Caudoviricetes sp.]